MCSDAGRLMQHGQGASSSYKRLHDLCVNVPRRTNHVDGGNTETKCSRHTSVTRGAQATAFGMRFPQGCSTKMQTHSRHRGTVHRNLR